MYLALVDRISRHRRVIADNDVIGGMTRALISFPHLPKETPCDLVFESDEAAREVIKSSNENRCLLVIDECPTSFRGIPIVVV